MKQLTQEAGEDVPLTGPGNVSLISPHDYELAIGRCWLESAQLARKEGLLQTAFTAILRASITKPPNLAIEKAKLLWEQGHQHLAIVGLQHGLSKVTAEERRSLEHANAMLLVGNWMAETARFTSDSVIKQYEEVIKLQPAWEDCYFALAKYHDSLLIEFDEKRDPHDTSVNIQFFKEEILPKILQAYGSSLVYGSKYIFQALPRLLTLWLDYGGVDLPTTGTTPVKPAKKAFRLNCIIERLINQLPAFQFIIALPQLISRICHPSNEVFELVEVMLDKLLCAYPQQTLWMMVALTKSTNTYRSQVSFFIFNFIIFITKVVVFEWWLASFFILRFALSISFSLCMRIHLHITCCI